MKHFRPCNGRRSKSSLPQKFTEPPLICLPDGKKSLSTPTSSILSPSSCCLRKSCIFSALSRSCTSCPCSSLCRRICPDSFFRSCRLHFLHIRICCPKKRCIPHYSSVCPWYFSMPSATLITIGRAH